MNHNQDLFSGKFSNYSKYRPGYPQNLLRLMEEHNALTPVTVVADIGSGTGIMSQLFLENGNTVYGVEPNDEMRQYSSISFRTYPNFHSVKGTGENTGLHDNSVGLVVCAQSFHWLNPDSVKKEFQRILIDQGHVGLIWNDKTQEENSFNSDYESICKRFKKFRPKYSSSGGTLIDHNIIDNFFKGSYKKMELENHQDLTLEGVMGRYSSTSYAIGPEEAGYESLVTEMKEAFRKYQNDGRVRIQYITKIFLGRV